MAEEIEILIKKAAEAKGNPRAPLLAEIAKRFHATLGENADPGKEISEVIKNKLGHKDATLLSNIMVAYKGLETHPGVPTPRPGSNVEKLISGGTEAEDCAVQRMPAAEESRETFCPARVR